MSSEILGSIESDGSGQVVGRRSRRALMVEILGPVTALGGVVWAILQPYRIAFLDPEGKGPYDYLVQPPLLVIGVGLLFALAIAPGLLEDLRAAEDGAAG